MSDGSRPTSRWSSARLTTMTTVHSNTPASPLLVSRKKLQRPARSTQAKFTDMTKTKHDMEEILKFCYSNETKIDTFTQTVTGRVMTYLFKFHVFFSKTRNTYCQPKTTTADTCTCSKFFCRKFIRCLQS